MSAPATFAPPPYTIDEDIKQGLHCYICDKKYKGYSWYNLLQHVRRHGVPTNIIYGTTLYREGTKEQIALQKARRAAQGENARLEAAAREDVKRVASQRRAKKAKQPVVPDTTGEAEAETGPEQVDAASSQSSHQTSHLPGCASRNELVWKQMATWVLCTWAGTPVTPLQASLSDPRAPSRYDDHSSQSSQSSTWSHGLPTVEVKHQYAAGEAPASLDETGSKPTYKQEGFKQYKARIDATDALIGFRNHLAVDMDNGAATVNDHCLAMTRVLHMLRVNGNDIWDKNVISDPMLVVAMYMHDVHKKVLNIPLLQVKFSWTRKILEGMTAYAGWHKQLAQKKLLTSDGGAWHKHVAAIDQFSKELSGGYAKRVHTEQARRREAKKVTDLNRIRALPDRETMKIGIRRAQLTLIHIERTTRTTTLLPEQLQSKANACLVGIIFCDGFAGRCQEWTLMKFDDVQKAIADGQDWILCPLHKTSHVYGSLAKWLAPGVVEAMKTYMRLPRPTNVATLLVPPRAHTETVAINKNIARFARVHLPSNCEVPTATLLRKSFHTVLMNLTDTEDKLLKLVEVIDAHSTAVARKHYVLRDPAADAKLAKRLVAVTLGDTVPWPQEGEIDTYITGPQLELTLPHCNNDMHVDSAELYTGDQHVAAEMEDEDDDELDWWGFASTFGVQKPLLAIEGSHEPAPMPLHDEIPEQMDVETDAVKVKHRKAPKRASRKKKEAAKRQSVKNKVKAKATASRCRVMSDRLPQRPSRRPRGYNNPVLNKVVRTKCKVTLRPEQQAWIIMKATVAGFSKSNAPPLWWAEQLVADGAIANEWGWIDPPTPKGITSLIRREGANDSGNKGDTQATTEEKQSDPQDEDILYCPITPEAKDAFVDNMRGCTQVVPYTEPPPQRPRDTTQENVAIMFANTEVFPGGPLDGPDVD